ncbi:MAG: Ditrans,polycis-undecaprenyl-diphosphate synthase ((2E,6E)-farnesyl-diphosphate specific) [Chlamydiia bacterium]|nr:Ditrans,polycis-undecaprenyl-diphosphate synthase ((2E,6E)-farnesyl-diphosphate specific) [Chlamydiia bacterium]
MNEMLCKSRDLLKKGQKNQGPYHVAIIMDGNRRFAKKENLQTEEGHLAGAKNLLKITEAALLLDIKVLTVFAFSTENWLRSDPEIQSLFHLFELYLMKMRPLLIENNIRLSTIGDISPFPMSLKTILFEVKNATKDGRALELVLAINYGGRDDMTRAVRSIVKDIESKKIDETEISEELIAKYLDTANWPDPDLLIRTSGEQRVSNFLLWQISYTEIFVAKTLWPEFTVELFEKAIETYKERNKRLGA